MCRVYAYVQESTSGAPSKDHVICSGLKRETTVYTSKSNIITVRMNTQGPLQGEGDEETTPQYLIRYEGNSACLRNEDIQCLYNEEKPR